MNGDVGVEYKLPRALHFQCVWLVKDMDRLASIVSRSDLEKSIKDGEVILYVDDMEKVLSDKVVREASRKLDCIERAIANIPEEYREGILENIKDSRELGDTAHSNTWKYWKQRFIYSLAKNLSLY